MTNKERFQTICGTNIKREGIDTLLAWMEQKSDFYTAPASTRYHLNEEGGLLLHSLHVYDRLCQLNQLFNLTDSAETLSIISLFHDLTKANCYKKGFRNVKEDGKWVQKTCYEFDEKFHYGGHGAKSVFLIERFMRLTPEEAVCIHNHMGPYDKPVGDRSLNQAYEQYPLAWLLHVADSAATYIDEVKE